jgi:hypothetical protein
MTREERMERIALARRILDWAELHDEFPLPIPMQDDLTLFVKSRKEALRVIETFGGSFRKVDNPDYVIMERDHDELGNVCLYIPKELTCRRVIETRTVPACEEHEEIVETWECPDSVLEALKGGIS